MGYCAELVRGDTFVISNPTAVLDRIKLDEPSMGHVSWCGLVDDYRKEFHYDDAQALAELLTNYGFWSTRDTTSVYVDGWQGDKIGGSWDRIWYALADGGIHHTVTWIMRGEDGDHWIEVIDNGQRFYGSCQAQYVVSSTHPSIDGKIIDMTGQVLA